MNTLNTAYKGAIKQLENLIEEYKIIEALSKNTKTSVDKKAAYFAKFRSSYSRIEKIVESVKEKQRSLQSAFNNKEDEKIYETYLFNLEEAEYLHNHAKSAVSVFIRDNKKAYTKALTLEVLNRKLETISLQAKLSSDNANFANELVSEWKDKKEPQELLDFVKRLLNSNKERRKEIYNATDIIEGYNEKNNELEELVNQSKSNFNNKEL